MSVLRNTFECKGIESIINVIRQEDSGLFKLVIGKKSYLVGSCDKGPEYLFFETGLSDECDEELRSIKLDISKLLPNTAIHYSWHSTMSDMYDSYYFGYMNNEYHEWEDSISYT